MNRTQANHSCKSGYEHDAAGDTQQRRKKHTAVLSFVQKVARRANNNSNNRGTLQRGKDNGTSPRRHWGNSPSAGCPALRKVLHWTLPSARAGQGGPPLDRWHLCTCCLWAGRCPPSARPASTHIFLPAEGRQALKLIPPKIPLFSSVAATQNQAIFALNLRGK